MQGVGTRTIIWRNGEDDFCLAKVGDVLALEEKCGAGIMTIMRRLETDVWYLNDVRETIRLGLIGGGMAPEKAMAAVKLHVDGNPNGLAPSVIIAHEVLKAVIIGVPDDPVGKQPAADAETQAQVSSTTTAASAAPPSSESDSHSNGHPPSLTQLPFGKSAPVSTDITEPIPTASSSPSL